MGFAICPWQVGSGLERRSSQLFDYRLGNGKGGPKKGRDYICGDGRGAPAKTRFYDGPPPKVRCPLSLSLSPAYCIYNPRGCGPRPIARGPSTRPALGVTRDSSRGRPPSRHGPHIVCECARLRDARRAVRHVTLILHIIPYLHPSHLLCSTLPSLTIIPPSRCTHSRSRSVRQS